jgi:hypothetical protein
MNVTLIQPVQPSVSRAAAAPGDTPRRLKVFVAFDEADCARNAEVLIHRVAPDESCDTEQWRLEQLAALSQGNVVAGSASEANLVIIALCGGSTLTQLARTWLSRSLMLRDDDREGVLVVLLSGAKAQPGANTELLAYLETLAILSRLKCFAGRAESKAASSAELAPLPLRDFAPFTTTIHAPVSMRGWGINE